MFLDGLTTKQRLFVLAYLGESKGNATDAARRAGYKVPEDSGRRLVRKSPIIAAIQAHLDSAALTTNQILGLLVGHATAEVDDFGHLDASGFRLDLAKARRRGRLHCVRKIRPVRVRVEDGDDGGRPRFRTEYELELYDAQKALELLGKFRGLFRDAPAPSPETNPLIDALRQAADAAGRAGEDR